MSLLVRDVMTTHPQTVAAGQSLSVAQEMMRGFEVRHLPVRDDGRLVGIVSDRDLARAGSHTPHAHTTRVAQAMTREIYVVSPGATVREVADTMAHQKIGCAVVVQDDHVVGILTTVDIARILAGCLTEPGEAPTCTRWGTIIPPPAESREPLAAKEHH